MSFPAPARRGQLRRGVSLIEVIVSLTLIAITGSSLAMLAVAASRRAAQSTAVMYRTAYLQEYAGHLQSVAFADLASFAGTTDFPTGVAAPHRRTITAVSTGTADTLRVTVKVALLDPRNTAVLLSTPGPDSLTFMRVKPPSSVLYK